MKNVYKLFVVLFLLSLTSQTFAQPTFGVKGGLSLSNQKWSSIDFFFDSDDFKMKPGFHIGPTIEVPITDMISFESGLILGTRGFKLHEELDFDGTVDVKMNINLLYLDVPLNLKAYFDAGGVKAYGSFGPYVGMGLSGKMKVKATYEGDTEEDSEDIEWGDDPENDMLKRLDFGLAFGAGVQLKVIDIGVAYGLGLTNISSYTDDGASIKNSLITLSVGYKF
jgi:hypothetical protein